MLTQLMMFNSIHGVGLKYLLESIISQSSVNTTSCIYMLMYVMRDKSKKIWWMFRSYKSYFCKAHLQLSSGVILTVADVADSPKWWYLYDSTSTSLWLNVLRKCSPVIDNNTALRQYMCQRLYSAVTGSRQNWGHCFVRPFRCFDAVDDATILSTLDHDFSVIKGKAQKGLDPTSIIECSTPL